MRRVIRDTRTGQIMVEENGQIRPMTPGEAEEMRAQSGGGAGRLAAETVGTGAVGAAASSAAAPLAAFGPPGIVASRVIPGIAVGGAQYGISRGFGEPPLSALKQAFGAGAMETVAPSMIRGAGKVLGPIGRGAARLTNRGFNPLATQALEAAAGMADDAGRGVAGKLTREGLEAAAQKSAQEYNAAYSEFRRLGGNAPVDLTDAADFARAQLKNPALTSAGQAQYREFVAKIDKITKGQLNPFELDSLDAYVSNLKRLQRSTPDGNVKHVVGELISKLEGSLDDAAKRATGPQQAVAELRRGRELVKAHAQQFGRGTRFGALLEAADDQASEAGARLLQSATKEEIEKLRTFLSPEQFAAARSSFFRDRVLRVDPQDASEVPIRTLRKTLQNRTIREQYEAYYGKGSAKWIDDVATAARVDRTLGPVFRMNGSLAVPLSAAGIWMVSGNTGVAAIGIGSLLYSQLVGTAAGRKVLTGLVKAASAGNQAGTRAALQAARKYMTESGLEGELTLEDRNGNALPLR